MSMKTEQLEPLATALAEMFAEERRQLRADIREERLDLDEKLFAATKRFDRLAAAFEERLAELKIAENDATA